MQLRVILEEVGFKTGQKSSLNISEKRMHLFFIIYNLTIKN